MTEPLRAWVTECLERIGAVTGRRMMGGVTLYCDGIVFAIIDDDELWFKADKVSDAEWDVVGAARFTYAKGDGSTGTMNYRRAPGDVHDDAEEMRRWASLALQAGQRGAARKRG